MRERLGRFESAPQVGCVALEFFHIENSIRHGGFPRRGLTSDTVTIQRGAACVGPIRKDDMHIAGGADLQQPYRNRFGGGRRPQSAIWGYPRPVTRAALSPDLTRLPTSSPGRHAACIVTGLKTVAYDRPSCPTTVISDRHSGSHAWLPSSRESPVCFYVARWHCFR